MKILSDINNFFKDKDGNLTIFLWPNVPLTVWLASKILVYFLPAGIFESGIEKLGSAAIFVWAYLEITKGTSNFRRLLGLLVLLSLIVGFFH